MGNARLSRSHDAGYGLTHTMNKIIILILTIIVTASITYIAAPRPYMAHHHANFAVYMDGKQRDFSGPSYMEEVSRCNVTE
jgi:hypothetical protein